MRQASDVASLKPVAWLGAVAASALLAGCAPDISDTIVTVPQHVASGEGSALARVPPARIAIVEIEDKRGVPGPAGWIGERKTIGDISMGSVEISPPPTDRIRQPRWFRASRRGSARMRRPVSTRRRAVLRLLREKKAGARAQSVVDLNQ